MFYPRILTPIPILVKAPILRYCLVWGSCMRRTLLLRVHIGFAYVLKLLGHRRSYGLQGSDKSPQTGKPKLEPSSPARTIHTVSMNNPQMLDGVLLMIEVAHCFISGTWATQQKPIKARKSPTKPHISPIQPLQKPCPTAPPPPSLNS